MRVFAFSDSFAAEERVHALLAHHRAATDREFFTITTIEALRLSLPILTEFLMHQEGTTLPASSGVTRLERIEEQILTHISERGSWSRAYEHEIEQHFSLSHTKVTLHIGRLLKRGFIRARRYDRHLPYYEIEHDGIQYLLDHQLVQKGAL